MEIPKAAFSFPKKIEEESSIFQIYEIADILYSSERSLLLKCELNQNLKSWQSYYPGQLSLFVVVKVVRVENFESKHKLSKNFRSFSDLDEENCTCLSHEPNYNNNTNNNVPRLNELIIQNYLRNKHSCKEDTKACCYNELKEVIECKDLIFMIYDHFESKDLLSLNNVDSKDLVIFPLIRSLLHNLKKFHSLEVIHGDIKPENILIHQAYDHLTAVLTDFECSKIIDGNLREACEEKRENIVISKNLGYDSGTFEYLSPERLINKNKEISSDDDYWALSVSLFVLFRNKFPFNFEGIETDAIYNYIDQALKTLNFELHDTDNTQQASSEFGQSFNDFINKALDPRLSVRQAFYQEIENHSLFSSDRMVFSRKQSEDDSKLKLRSLHSYTNFTFSYTEYALNKLRRLKAK